MLKVVGGLSAKPFFKVMPDFFLFLNQNLKPNPMKPQLPQHHVCCHCSHTDFKRIVSD